MQATDLLLAHSSKSDERGTIPSQSYRNHILGGLKKIKKILNGLYDHVEDDHYHLEAVVMRAFQFHDLGKLCNYSQQILDGRRKGKMPNHTDAGAACLSQVDVLAAWMVKCHHRGFDILGDLDSLRDMQFLSHRCPYVSPEDAKLRMRQYTQKVLPKLMERHASSTRVAVPFRTPKNWESGLFMRIAMSILVDADHYDTAKHYGHRIIEKKVSLKPGRRLIALEDYVSGLSEVHGKSEIKESVFQACRTAKENGLVLCKSEVGTGKTTALMAYALRQAALHNKRRIFYCAPYTSIISQTVEVFRKALVLPVDEQPHLVVAEHHSQVDPEEGLTEDRLEMMGDESVAMIREFAQTWQAPIVCTTAVQLFETLAGCRTGRLRKLHNIVGSIIVIDESHMTMRPELWPLALIWLKELVDRFGCFVVFASGSMVQPWNSEELNILLDNHVRNQSGRKAAVLPNLKFDVQSIIPKELAELTLANEQKRVNIQHFETPYDNAKDVCDMILQRSGSRVVVCNTIHNAAVLARHLQKSGEDVLHISTALTPADRELTLDRVKKKLKTPDNWTLVATSCVEAGIDISFDHGFRENSSLMSVLQLAGRVNRYGTKPDSDLVVFSLNYDNGLFTDNPEFYTSKQVFKKMFREGRYGPEHCAEAFDRSLAGGCDRLPGKSSELPEISVSDLLQMEANLNLKGVADYFNVVSGDKRTIIIGDRFNICEEGRSIVKKCVQIYEDRLERWKEFIAPADVPGFYFWTGQYDNFIGYYAQFV
jgi:CRISPR-associated endonuclease/helicase Cas3